MSRLWLEAGEGKGSGGSSVRLLNALRKRHQSFYLDVGVRSMKDSVQSVIEYAEEGIREWMDTP